MKQLFEQKVTLNKKSQIVELNQTLQPVRPKPYFMDLAAGAVEYPDLSSLIGEQKKGGWFSGWGWGKK